MGRNTPRQVLVGLGILVALFAVVDSDQTGQSINFQGWNDYWQSWVGSQYYPRMYPFGSQYGDAQVTSTGNGFDAGIKFSLPFYGRNYPSLYIAVEGNVQPSTYTPSRYTQTAVAIQWPNENYPDESDPAFIAPYYAQWEQRANSDPGTIDYRVLDTRAYPNQDNFISVVEGTLRQISYDVRSQTVGAHSPGFMATYGIVVTWDNMLFYGCTATPCPTNTVQLALVTDGHKTFAVFNFWQLNWMGGTLQYCDPITGNQPTDGSGTCFPAQVGFNAGNARGFTQLPYSNTNQVRQLQNSSGSITPGRWINEIGSDWPIRGGCTNDTSLSNNVWEMEMWPAYGDMLGGQAVYVSGPCFLQSMASSIRCNFNGTVVQGHLVEYNITKAACVQPTLFATGNITVQLSVDSGSTWKYWNDYYVTQPGINQTALELVDRDLWFNRTSEYLTVQWDPEAVMYSWEINNTNTLTYNTYVDISIWSYSEWKSGSQYYSSWGQLLDLSTYSKNTGTYTFKTRTQRCTTQADCNWNEPLPIGLMSVKRLMSDGSPDGIVIWSDPVTLGWYVNYQFNHTMNDHWPNTMCTRWYNNENHDQGWKNSLLTCPYTYGQIVADYRFIRDDNCTETSDYCAPVFYKYGIEDQVCFSQGIQGVSSMSSMSRCCYGSDGQLMYAGDSVNGSDSQRASPYGMAPYNDPTRVPLLSNMVWDRGMKQLCCNWTVNNETYCLGNYMAMRNTQDASQYRPSAVSIAYGDPHFQTFDGTNYTFNGFGEYWLLKTQGFGGYSDFMMQGRLQQPYNQTWGAIWATVLSAVAMKEGSDPTDTEVPLIEARLNYNQSFNTIEIMVDGVLQNFSHFGERVRTYMSKDRTRKVVIVNNILNNVDDQSNFTIIFQNGIGIQVAAVGHWLLKSSLSLPRAYYRTYTSGLFGWWNNNPANDLMTPSGNIIQPSQSVDYIHQYFGQTWVVDQANSLFTYRAKLNWAYYSYPNFVPNYAPPPIPSSANFTASDVNALCGSNFPCQYDYQSTLSRTIAQSTLQTQQWTSQVQNSSNYTAMCSYIHVRNSIRTVDTYEIGGTVEFTNCTQNHFLAGPRTYHCNAHSNCNKKYPTYDCLTGRWSPETVHMTNCLSESQLALVIAIPVLIACLIAAVVVVVACYCCECCHLCRLACCCLCCVCCGTCELCRDDRCCGCRKLHPNCCVTVRNCCMCCACCRRIHNPKPAPPPQPSDPTTISKPMPLGPEYGVDRQSLNSSVSDYKGNMGMHTQMQPRALAYQGYSNPAGDWPPTDDGYQSRNHSSDTNDRDLKNPLTPTTEVSQQFYNPSQTQPAKIVIKSVPSNAISGNMAATSSMPGTRSATPVDLDDGRSLTYDRLDDSPQLARRGTSTGNHSPVQSVAPHIPTTPAAAYYPYTGVQKAPSVPNVAYNPDFDNIGWADADGASRTSLGSQMSQAAIDAAIQSAKPPKQAKNGKKGKKEDKANPLTSYFSQQYPKYSVSNNGSTVSINLDPNSQGANRHQPNYDSEV